MKVHRVVQMVGLTNESGRLASDMYELNDKMYRSESTNEEIPISHMDFQHLIRAFVKQNTKSYYRLGANDIVLTKDDVIKSQEKIINGLRSQVETYKEKNEKLEGIIEEKDEIIDFNRKKFHYWHKAYNEVTDVKGCRYVFSEIPNDTEGQEFVDTCKKYLNKPSYKIRVKGQHLKKELYGQNRASYGVNLGDSTHMRVYIDKKIGDE
tara:strand:+ start:2999 stop:3622 length:624 start_codon:yes stop_codon:yes gene_type:complete